MRRAFLAVSLVALSCARGCGSTAKAPVASPATLDAAEIENATGTASPYVRGRAAEREPVRGAEVDARPRAWPPENEDAGAAAGPPPREFSEEPPPDERTVPADRPDAGAADSGALEDARDALSNPDAH